MSDLKNMTDQVIDRMRNLQEFTVLRDIENIPFNGEFPYTLQHRQGEPAQVKVWAVDQAEAETRVNEWIGSIS